MYDHNLVMVSDLQIRTLPNRIQRKAPLRYREGLFDLLLYFLKFDIFLHISIKYESSKSCFIKFMSL